MIEEKRILTARDWNEGLNILNGTQIVEFLQPFSRDKALELKPPLKKIEKKIKAALKNLNFSPKEIEVVCVNEKNYCPEDYSKGFGQPLWSILMDAVEKEISKRLINSNAAMLEEYFSYSFTEELQNNFYAHVKEKISLFLADIALNNVKECLKYQIAFLILQDEEYEKKIALFTNLFRQGNFPLGINQHKEFIVLVS